MSRRVPTDHAHDAKRREQVYQHWYAEVLRESRDNASLLRVQARAMDDSEVASDPELAEMIRGCCMQVQQDLARRSRETTRTEAHVMAAPVALKPVTRVEEALWTREQVISVLAKLDHDFHDHLTRLDEPRARSALAKMEALLADYADCIDADHLIRCNRELSRVEARKTALGAQVAKLHEHAVACARAGDQDGAARALQRLSAIHAARPLVLPAERFRHMREDMLHVAEAREHRQAAGELVRRERAVAEEIRKLADGVHRFHVIARRVPHDSAEYLAAEKEYQYAVKQVRSHDNDWMAALILELMDLLEEWHDASHQGQQQVDRFLDSVRSALDRLQKQIREIEQEGRRN
ncbi:MAG: hypothetical protein IT449_19280 [Phycisphaerales bacterium]|nr:hypothetical protein [Phycisphaerales bacterium]